MTKAPDFPPWSIGDRQPPLVIQVYNPDGITPMNMTGKTFTFEIALTNGTGAKLGSAGVASLVGAAVLGQIQYAWGSGDIAVAGDYDAVAIITTTSGGAQQTYPPEPLRVVFQARV